MEQPPMRLVIHPRRQVPQAAPTVTDDVAASPDRLQELTPLPSPSRSATATAAVAATVSPQQPQPLQPQQQPQPQQSQQQLYQHQQQQPPRFSQPGHTSGQLADLSDVSSSPFVVGARRPRNSAIRKDSADSMPSSSASASAAGATAPPSSAASRHSSQDISAADEADLSSSILARPPPLRVGSHPSTASTPSHIQIQTLPSFPHAAAADPAAAVSVRSVDVDVGYSPTSRPIDTNSASFSTAAPSRQIRADTATTNAATTPPSPPCATAMDSQHQPRLKWHIPKSMHSPIAAVGHDTKGSADTQQSLTTTDSRFVAALLAEPSAARLQAQRQQQQQPQQQQRPPSQSVELMPPAPHNRSFSVSAAESDNALPVVSSASSSSFASNLAPPPVAPFVPTVPYLDSGEHLVSSSAATSAPAAATALRSPSILDSSPKHSPMSTMRAPPPRAHTPRLEQQSSHEGPASMHRSLSFARRQSSHSASTNFAAATAGGASTPSSITFQPQQPLPYAVDADDFDEGACLPPLAHMLSKPTPCYFFHPDSRGRIAWSTGLILLILFSVFEVPLSICFDYENPPSVFALGIFIDIYFLVDIAVTFLTGYYASRDTHAAGSGGGGGGDGSGVEDSYSSNELYDHGSLVTDHREIAKHYIKGWLLLDVAGSIPFDMISMLSGSSQGGTKVLFVLRVFKVPRLLKMLKLTKIVDLRSHRHVREIMRMLKLVSIMIIVGHWVACGFMLLARSESSATTTWAQPIMDRSLGSQYVFCLYWSLTVLSTVGFGDIVPLTEAEMLYTCFVMLIGAILYAVVVGNVMLVLAALNAPEQRHTETLLKVSDYLKSRKVPSELATKVLNYTEAEWKRMQGHNEREILAHLPESLSTQIARHLHASMLRKVGFFQGSHSGFINAVVLSLHTSCMLSDTIIIRRNQPGDRMFFVARGAVELIDRGQVYAVLKEGAYLGESAFLDGLYRVTARSATYCELCILYRSDFERIVKHYPDFLNIINQQADATSLMASKKHKLKALFS